MVVSIFARADGRHEQFELAKQILAIQFVKSNLLKVFGQLFPVEVFAQHGQGRGFGRGHVY